MLYSPHHRAARRVSRVLKINRTSNTLNFTGGDKGSVTSDLNQYHVTVVVKNYAERDFDIGYMRDGVEQMTDIQARNGM